MSSLLQKSRLELTGTEWGVEEGSSGGEFHTDEEDYLRTGERDEPGMAMTTVHLSVIKGITWRTH